MRTLFISLLALTCSLASAAEIVWLRLASEFLYEDISVHCKADSFLNETFFSAEVENGVVVKAALSKASYATPSGNIVFNEQEVKTVELYKDSFGRYWLKNLSLTGRLATWSLSHFSIYSCQIPKPLKSTIEPDPIVFTFDTQGLGEDKIVSESNRTSFNGLREDKRPYHAEIVFTQKLYKNEE
ncbi:MAG: hypothetical protein HY537_13535 [Deltaproteobacteria bacterium]|nr:hypothetical protein [Deltaproteobacteria bacterium]